VTSELTNQYKGIGKIVVSFNQLDAELNSFIGALIGDDLGTGQIITSQIQSVTNRLELFLILYKYKISKFGWVVGRIQKKDFRIRDKLINAANNLRKEGDQINAIRNRIMHSYWFQQQRHTEQYGKRAPLTGLLIKPTSKSSKPALNYEVVDYKKKELAVYQKRLTKFVVDLRNLRKKTPGLK
jgi:hypothetical protein